MTRSMRYGALICIAILLVLGVRGEIPATGGNFGSTTQPTPGFESLQDRVSAVAPSTQPASMPPPDVTDEQVGNSITRGVEFLLSNFDKTQLKPIDGEDGDIEHAGLNALCIDALLETWQSTHDQRLKPGEPLMRGFLNHLSHANLIPADKLPAPTVYAHAMRALALAVINRPEDHSVLANDVAWLLHAHRDGAYTFDDHFDSPTEVVPVDAQSPMASDMPSIPGATGANGIVSNRKFTGKSGPWPGPRILIIHSPFPLRQGPQIDARPARLKEPYEPDVPNTPEAPFTRRPNLSPTELTEELKHLRSTTAPVTAGGVYPPLPYPWDAANSMFGLLGVRAGAESGIDIPNQYWMSVQNHWLHTETRSGTWSFDDRTLTTDIGSTFAGDFSLLVTHDWVGMSQKPIGRW